ncbi:pre-mRNA-splicing factor CWC22 homolog [Cololabis saira]|uniref:pre-mRNA-splicing factor CWC22 homolog n=1 Tax=Cololabis saira TaxID=129043 RepID=UPI002AD5710F|nr:pre-mRNA-splicing factor CWC22 homolog [Cololabis saira]
MAHRVRKWRRLQRSLEERSDSSDQDSIDFVTDFDGTDSESESMIADPEVTSSSNRGVTLPSFPEPPAKVSPRRVFRSRSRSRYTRRLSRSLNTTPSSSATSNHARHQSSSHSTRRPSTSHSTRRPSRSPHARRPSRSPHARRPSRSPHARRPSRSPHARRPSRSPHARRPSRSPADRNQSTSRYARYDVKTWTFPLPEEVFQKMVLTLLLEIRDKDSPQTSAHVGNIVRMETMEQFDEEEVQLMDPSNFERMVQRLARVGGRGAKGCVRKVLDRLFTNTLMAQFNMMGKGQKDKRALKGTKVLKAIQEGVMRFDKAATEDLIQQTTADHLKHAPQRRQQ